MWSYLTSFFSKSTKNNDLRGEKVLITHLSKPVSARISWPEYEQDMFHYLETIPSLPLDALCKKTVQSNFVIKVENNEMVEDGNGFDGSTLYSSLKKKMKTGQHPIVLMMRSFYNNYQELNDNIYFIQTKNITKSLRSLDAHMASGKDASYTLFVVAEGIRYDYPVTFNKIIYIPSRRALEEKIVRDNLNGIPDIDKRSKKIMNAKSNVTIDLTKVVGNENK